MDFEKIEEILKNEPKFRLKQVKNIIFQDLIESWDKTTILPKNLRQKLSENYPLEIFKTAKIFSSEDNQTIKALLTLKDGLKIESVLMKHKEGRRTVCLSSQIGCSMGCKFCATGQQGFKRNLSISEIINQVLFFARILKKENKKITNIVFMGMGEPFLNYDNVLSAIKILNDKDGFNLGSRHISISTCGIIEKINKLSEEKLQINLAISLHAPDNKLRSELMPINKEYPLNKVLETVDNYIKKTKRRVMFEYLTIDGVNDSQKNAEDLAKILKKPLYFINLISYNPIGHSDFKSSPVFKVKKFKEILERNGVTVTQRHRFGKEIKAACGQLAVNK